MSPSHASLNASGCAPRPGGFPAAGGPTRGPASAPSATTTVAVAITAFARPSTSRIAPSAASVVVVMLVLVLLHRPCSHRRRVLRRPRHHICVVQAPRPSNRGTPSSAAAAVRLSPGVRCTRPVPTVRTATPLLGVPVA